MSAVPEIDSAIAALKDDSDLTGIERVATAAIYVDRVDDAREGLG